MITIYLFTEIILDGIRKFYYGNLEDKVEIIITTSPMILIMLISIIIDIVLIPIYLLFDLICLILKLLERRK